MSKKEEILHKLRTEDRNYIKEKFKEKDAKIADLEAKLAESESESNARYSAWQEEIGECDRLRVALAEKDAEVQSWKDGTMVVKLGKLEQQIAEKDQAIEGLQEINQSLWQTCNNDAKEIERLREQLEDKEKEKIEFAIKQLKKANRRLDEMFGVCDYGHWDLFDQQIKSLKGEK